MYQLNEDLGLGVFEFWFSDIHVGRLTAEISRGIHALRSTEQPRVSGVVGLIVSEDLGEEMQDREVGNGIGDEVPRLQESIAVATSREENGAVWPSITDGDMACSYVLGKFTLEMDIVVELFQQ